MNKFLCAVSGIALAMGVAGCSGGAGEEATAEASAETGLAGTWVVDTETATFEDDNNSYLVADGQYTCQSCDPPYSVAASGEWVEVDRPSVDAVKFAIVDDMTVTSAGQRNGKEVGNSTWTVSEDGQTMTVAWNDLEGAEATSGTTTYARTAAGPEGAHAVSGDWKVTGVGDMSEAARTVTYALDGDTVTITGNNGTTTLTLGGDAVTPAGDETGGMTAMEKVSDNVYRQTYSRDGEVLSVTEVTIEGDTLTGVNTSPKDGSKVTWTAKRKS